MAATTTELVTHLEDEATRAEIEEALHYLGKSAARQLRKDHIGRENARWVSLHGYIDDLLDAWQKTPCA